MQTADGQAQIRQEYCQTIQAKNQHHDYARSPGSALVTAACRNPNSQDNCQEIQNTGNNEVKQVKPPEFGNGGYSVELGVLTKGSLNGVNEAVVARIHAYRIYIRLIAHLFLSSSY